LTEGILKKGKDPEAQRVPQTSGNGNTIDKESLKKQTIKVPTVRAVGGETQRVITRVLRGRKVRWKTRKGRNQKEGIRKIKKFVGERRP